MIKWKYKDCFNGGSLNQSITHNSFSHSLANQQALFPQRYSCRASGDTCVIRSIHCPVSRKPMWTAHLGCTLHTQLLHLWGGGGGGGGGHGMSEGEGGKHPMQTSVKMCVCRWDVCGLHMKGMCVVWDRCVPSLTCLCIKEVPHDRVLVTSWWWGWCVNRSVIFSHLPQQFLQLPLVVLHVCNTCHETRT